MESIIITLIDTESTNMLDLDVPGGDIEVKVF